MTKEKEPEVHEGNQRLSVEPGEPRVRPLTPEETVFALFKAASPALKQFEDPEVRQEAARILYGKIREAVEAASREGRYVYLEVYDPKAPKRGGEEVEMPEPERSADRTRGR